MKVLLIVPPKKSYFGLEKFPPVGLGYIATALRKHNHEIQIVDCVRDQISLSGLKQVIEEKKPDVVGITVWSLSLKEASDALKLAKSLNNVVITVVGGPHPSAMPKETMNFLKEADFGFQGEGETGMPLLLDYLSKRSLKLSDIPGLLWMNNGEICSNPPVFQEDLDSLGFPSWDLMNPQFYWQAGSTLVKHSAFLITTRGCPFPCTFCSASIIAGRKIRKRTLDNIISEIKMLISNYNVNHFVIFDENFTFERDRAIEFCKRVLNEKLKLKFSLPNGVRLDTLNEELLLVMKKAGFSRILAVGIESGSDRVLKLMKKNVTKAQIKEKVMLMRKIGFKPIGYFILGFPGERKEEMLESVSFAKELKLYRAAFTPFLPLPNTEIFNKLVKEGEISPDFDFTLLSTDKITYAPCGMSFKELDDMRRYALLKIHMQPRVLFNFLKDYSSLRFALSKFFNIFILRKNISLLNDSETGNKK